MIKLKKKTIDGEEGYYWSKNNQSIFVTESTRRNTYSGKEEPVNKIIISGKRGRDFTFKSLSPYSKVDDILDALNCFQHVRRRNPELQQLYEYIKNNKHMLVGNKSEKVNSENPAYDDEQAVESSSESFGGFPIKDKKVKQLGLSTRPTNALINAGITQSDFIPTTMKELKAIKNMGTKSAQEILDLMEKNQ